MQLTLATCIWQEYFGLHSAYRFLPMHEKDTIDVLSAMAGSRIKYLHHSAWRDNMTDGTAADLRISRHSDC